MDLAKLLQNALLQGIAGQPVSGLPANQNMLQSALLQQLTGQPASGLPVVGQPASGLPSDQSLLALALTALGQANATGGARQPAAGQLASPSASSAQPDWVGIRGIWGRSQGRRRRNHPSSKGGLAIGGGFPEAK